MNDWTLGSFLLALLGVILGGAAVGFILQRSLFRNLRLEEPMVMFRRLERNKVRSGLAVLVGLALLGLLYPLFHRLDIDLSGFGVSDKMLTFLLILGGGLLLRLFLYWRNKDR